jgi:hypothetical protein
VEENVDPRTLFLRTSLTVDADVDADDSSLGLLVVADFREVSFKTISNTLQNALEDWQRVGNDLANQVAS